MTAATQNTETRDHLTFLKGFGDLITNSTTADTGTATYLSITRATAVVAFQAKITADTFARVMIDAGGAINFGSGSAAQDVYINRSVNQINLVAGTVNIPAAILRLTEIGTAPAGGADGANLFVIDSGAGKSILKVQFGTGAAQTIATEP